MSIEKKPIVTLLQGAALETAKRLHSNSMAAQRAMAAMDQEFHERRTALCVNSSNETKGLVAQLLIQAGYDPELDRPRLEALDLSYMETSGHAYLTMAADRPEACACGLKDDGVGQELS